MFLLVMWFVMMDKLKQSIEMFNNIQMSSVGIEDIAYGDRLLVKFDMFRILELRSSTESFDQKFGKFLLDYVESSSLKFDRHEIDKLLKHNAK